MSESSFQIIQSNLEKKKIIFELWKFRLIDFLSKADLSNAKIQLTAASVKKLAPVL